MKLIFVVAALALVALACFQSADAGMIVARQHLGEEVSADYEQMVVRDPAYVFAELTETIAKPRAAPRNAAKAKKPKAKGKKKNKGKKAGKKGAKKAGKKAGKKAAKAAGKKGAKKAGKKAAKKAPKAPAAGAPAAAAAAPKKEDAPKGPPKPSCPKEPKDKREKCINDQKKKVEAAYLAARKAATTTILDRAASIGADSTKLSDENFRMKRACDVGPTSPQCVKSQRAIGKMLKSITKDTRATLKSIKQQLAETKALQQKALDIRKNLKFKSEKKDDKKGKKKDKKKGGKKDEKK